MKSLKFFFVTIVSLFAIIYLIYVSYVYLNQAEIVFQASKLSPDYKFDFKEKFEEINIPSFDSKKINGLLFTTPNPKGLVFYLHGNAGMLDTWGNNSKIYTNLGYDFFILDYRGFGKSEGEIETETQVNKDVQIVYNELSKRYDSNKIIICGYSIGTGVATFLASNVKSKALILQAPFYNFTEFTESRVPFYPNFLKKFEFETNLNITKVKSPIYIFHGILDQLIPIENSQKLKKLLKPNDQFLELKDQDHIGINENFEFQEKLKLILI
jgi:uncharacterized protein